MSLKVLTQEYVAEAERLDQKRRAEKKPRPVEGFPFWPHEVIRAVIVLAFFSAAMLYLSGFMPYFLEAPANPAGQPDVILPDWYLLFSYGFLKWGNDFTLLNGPDGAWVANWWHVWDQQWWTPWDLGPHTGIVQMPVIGAMNAKLVGLIGIHTPLILAVFALPFIDRGKAQRPQEQPAMAAWGVFVLGITFMASVYSINNVIYNRWPIMAETILKDQISPIFQFFQWDLLSWLTMLIPMAMGIITYVLLRTYRDNMMAAGDRVFKLNRNYYRVR
ncbi:MAG: hypothetical protein R3185_01135 [Candidatus Thermoplasmatota archaeon]|nr:hypothetical protein [Candidatus Thermoplasmatota archaeon]